MKVVLQIPAAQELAGTNLGWMELFRGGHTQNVELANTERAVSIVFVCFEDTVSISRCRLNRTSNPCHPRANQGCVELFMMWWANT